MEHITAEHQIARLEARNKDLTEALDLLNHKLETTDSLSVVAHKQGATSADKPPSVH